MACFRLCSIKPAVVFVLLLLLPFKLAAGNAIYQWTDENGQVHFGNRKPPANAQNIEAQPPNVFSNAGNADLPLPALPAKKPRVDMYATEWCGYCSKARRYFRAHQIAFTEYDIEKDSAAKQRFDRFGGRAVPVIFIDGERSNGFDPQNF